MELLHTVHFTGFTWNPEKLLRGVGMQLGNSDSLMSCHSACHLSKVYMQTRDRLRFVFENYEGLSVDIPLLEINPLED